MKVEPALSATNLVLIGGRLPERHLDRLASLWKTSDAAENPLRVSSGVA